MRYVLAFLSHGNPYSDTAEACIDSFLDHVTPAPAFVVYQHDGPGYAYCSIGQREGAVFSCKAGGDQVGFCRATRDLWVSAVAAAITIDADHVFWLEHDFLFRQPVDLGGPAMVLDSEHTLAQLALMRGPVNQREQHAGGLVASRPGEFTLREGLVTDLMTQTGAEAIGVEWLQHVSYFTTNPSLMRMEFMRDNVWPEYESECEGRYGIDLIEAGYSFGVWGDGSPQVEHIGARTGKGY